MAVNVLAPTIPLITGVNMRTSVLTSTTRMSPEPQGEMTFPCPSSHVTVTVGFGTPATIPTVWDSMEEGVVDVYEAPHLD
jgi:hypothetical protein